MPQNDKLDEEDKSRKDLSTLHDSIQGEHASHNRSMGRNSQSL
jgi:hypothetical protein